MTGREYIMSFQNKNRLSQNTKFPRIYLVSSGNGKVHKSMGIARIPVSFPLSVANFVSTIQCIQAKCHYCAATKSCDRQFVTQYNFSLLRDMGLETTSYCLQHGEGIKFKILCIPKVIKHVIRPGQFRQIYNTDSEGNMKFRKHALVAGEETIA